MAKCKAVLDMVQSSAYQIQVLQVNAGSEGPNAYRTTYFDNAANWLRIHEVLPEGVNETEAGSYYNRMAHLHYNGQSFNNDGHWGEQGDIIWEEMENDALEEVRTGRTSMLTTFQWDSSYVTYLDTLSVENGQCIMLRIDKKYCDQDDYTDHYFANFYFDTNGSFREVKLQVNLYQDNACMVTESIVTLDAAKVTEQIESYFLHGSP